MRVRTHSLALAVAGLMACGGPASTGETGPAKPAESRRIEPAANGLRLPADYRNWPLIAVSRRNDKDSLRAIVGNPVAVRAARQGTTAPWPDGTILAKIVWKDAPLASWEAALVPTELVHVEIMVKDSSRFGEHGGWGFARWVGN